MKKKGKQLVVLGLTGALVLGNFIQVEGSSRTYKALASTSVVANNSTEGVKDSEEYLGISIVASDRLEYALANAMLRGVSELNITSYDIRDQSLLEDKIRKVQLQNPLILGVNEFTLRTLTTKEGLKVDRVYFDYSLDVKKMLQKQNQIAKEVTKFVNINKKLNLTEDEKVKVIYNYLSRKASYDKESVKYVGANDIPDKYKDSFTAYGVLVKGKGVCSSYASATHLLAKAMGLDSVVVTGKLDDVAHAWNKVKINGKWYNFDVTNNEKNSGVPFILYNATDEVAESLGYSFDNEYWTDKDISMFNTEDIRYDYYIQNKLEFNDVNTFKEYVHNSLKSKKLNKLHVRFNDINDVEKGVKVIYIIKF